MAIAGSTNKRSEGRQHGDWDWLRPSLVGHGSSVLCPRGQPEHARQREEMSSGVWRLTQ